MVYNLSADISQMHEIQKMCAKFEASLRWFSSEQSCSACGSSAGRPLFTGSFIPQQELGLWTLLRAGLALGLVKPLLLTKSWIGNCLWRAHC